MEGLIAIGIVIVIVGYLLTRMINIVNQYERIVIFAFGRFDKVAGPGFVFVLPPPFQSVARTIDLREFVVEIPQQTCITSDNAPIAVDFLIYQRVIEEQAKDSFLNIQNFRQAINGIAQTTLRSVIGNIPLDDVLSKREQINESLRVKLDEITHRWGMKVTNVEIKEIVPPRDIQDAMNRQMSAERNRRAAILEAEGKKQSAILVAEGDKQSNILQAEGAKQAQALRAEGFAVALQKINEAAITADARTMTLQYLDALRTIGTSASTKFVIPTEFTTLLQPLIGMTQRAGEPAGNGPVTKT